MEREREGFVFANFVVSRLDAPTPGPSPIGMGERSGRKGRQFVLTNFDVSGIERGFGQLVCGLGRGFLKLVQAVARFQRDAEVGFWFVAAFPLGDVEVFQYLLAQATGVKLGNVLGEQLDGGINLAVQGRFMAQHFVKPV